MAAVVSTADDAGGDAGTATSGDILLDNKCELLSLAPEGCRKVLVLGMGGGCDVVVACALAEMMCDTAVLAEGTEIHFGNCVSPREMDDHPKVSPHIYGVPQHDRTLEAGTNTYGTTLTEQSLPAGPFVCRRNGAAGAEADGGAGSGGGGGDGLVSPILCIVPSKSGSVEEVTRANSEALVPELQALGFDWVLGVDAGGDSLTGGIDFIEGGSPETGRDRQMLHVLTSLQGVHFTHAVIGPCCDGESEQHEMASALEDAAAQNQFKGSFSLDPFLPYLRKLVVGQGPTRTPVIMIRAFEGDLEAAPAEAGAEAEATGADSDKVVIPRNRKCVISRSWIMVGAALEYPEGKALHITRQIGSANGEISEGFVPDTGTYVPKEERSTGS